jgi:hypothetical protein
MICKYLFCNEPAGSRVTVPHYEPRMPVCQTHLEETLRWADRARKYPGRILVEHIADDNAQ